MTTPEIQLVHEDAALSGASRYGFFGRPGGVSTGLFAGLNCGPGSGDAPSAVTENRERAAASLGLEPDRLVTLYQVHSPDVVRVDTPWTRDDAPKADAMVSTTPGLGLGILTADCCPVLFADPQSGVIGAAHAGWKGAFAGVLEATVAAMETAGARRVQIHAAIGPTISLANYEVGPEFRDRFLDADPDNAVYFQPSQREDHWQFDLPAFAAARLRAAGVGSIGTPGPCTYAHEDALFSYRRATHRNEPDYGRNLSVIALPPA